MSRRVNATPDASSTMAGRGHPNHQRCRQKHDARPATGDRHTGRPTTPCQPNRLSLNSRANSRGLSDELGQRRPAAGDHHHHIASSDGCARAKCVASASHAQIAPTLTGTAASVISARPRSWRRPATMAGGHQLQGSSPQRAGWPSQMPGVVTGCRRRLARCRGRPPEHRRAAHAEQIMRPKIGGSGLHDPRSIRRDASPAPPAATVCANDDGHLRRAWRSGPLPSWHRQHAVEDRRQHIGGDGPAPQQALCRPHPPARNDAGDRRWHKWTAHHPATATGHDKRQSAATPSHWPQAANFARLRQTLPLPGETDAKQGTSNG